MLDVKDFTFFDKQNSFDFKGFLIKTISYWKWFAVGLIIAFSIAHQVNVRKQKIYGIETTIAVQDENNPFFTSNTSLVFNWGGTSDKVQMISTTLKSRSQNEIVVDKLQFYVDYLKQTKYFLKDFEIRQPRRDSVFTERSHTNHAVVLHYVVAFQFAIASCRLPDMFQLGKTSSVIG